MIGHLKWVTLGMTLVCTTACHSDEEAKTARATARSLDRLADSQVRVVWCQDQDPRGTDLFAESERFQLMGFDSADRKGERPLCPQPGNYSRPLLSPSGWQVIFSDRNQRHFYALTWDGKTLTDLGEGFAMEAWIDPATGVEWIYFGDSPRKVTRQDVPAYSSISRCRLDQPSIREKIWDATPLMQMTENNFLLSADGKRASLVTPQICGVAALDENIWKPYGKGCWPAVAPDNSYRYWLFEGGHRAIHFFDATGSKIGRVPLNTGEDMDGLEVFHPRWSNHPRLFAVAGPLRIPGGGPGVEIYVGRFAADYSSVDKWVRISHNDKADFFPDVWVSRIPIIPPASVPSPPPPVAAPPSNTVSSQSSLIVKARLIATSKIPPPPSIAPYRRALIGNRYEVIEVLRGSLSDKEFIGAHWGIRDAQILPQAQREKGRIYTLHLISIDDDDTLKSERLIVDGQAEDLLLFYDSAEP
jgi:hypothetical protein